MCSTEVRLERGKDKPSFGLDLTSLAEAVRAYMEAEIFKHTMTQESL